MLLFYRRKERLFSRALRLPDTLDAGKARPYCQDEVLTVTLPKVQAKKGKQLDVQV